jgi:hypothetical protein
VLKKLKFVVNVLVKVLIDWFVVIVTLNTSKQHMYDRVFTCMEWFFLIFRFPYLLLRPASHLTTLRRQLLEIALVKLQQRSPGYPIPFKIVGSNHLLDFLHQGQTPIVISPHLRVTSLLSSYLDRNGYRSAIVSSPNLNVGGLNVGMGKEIFHIKPDKKCFFEIRRYLSIGIPVLVFPDYDKKQASGKMQKLISPNVFKFVEIHQLALLFMWVDIAKDGTVLIEFVAPKTRNRDELTHQFIKFIKDRIEWDVRLNNL